MVVKSAMTSISSRFRPRLPRSLFQPRNFAVYLYDIFAAFVAFAGAFILRLGAEALLEAPDILAMAGGFAFVAAIAYLYTGLYRHVWEYVSAKDAVNILRTATITVLVFLPAWFFATRLENLPRSLPFLGWIMMVMLLAGPRLVYRQTRRRYHHSLFTKSPNATPVLLVGAGPEAEHFIRALERQPNAGYRAIGMVTARPERVGQVIQGVDVLGRDGDLPRVVAELERKGQRPEKVVLVRPDISGPEVQKLLEMSEQLGLTLARVPISTDVHAYDGADLKPRPIALADLLGRPQTRLDRAAMTSMVQGRRVLITGAGGSIGSELVRQICAAGVGHLSLVDFGEFNLYTIDLEVREKYPTLSCATVLADVRDADRMRDVITREKPDLVFHAAALKHVPMVEMNPVEGLMTNAIGTRNVAAACAAGGVKAMVLISTDKAVNPSNVMGAAKRLAEIYCQAEDLRRAGTRFITVRFGNVLGSTGSVVSLFQRQLEAGGPLTVTHPEVERYFMTVREAVELVLQAAALGQGRNDEGAIYVLDMGERVKIIDLAHQMIHLAGKMLGRDIDIKIVGLRPGEKLKEELFHGEEPAVGTDMAGILIARPRTVDHAVAAARLSALEDACRNRDESKALGIVTELVPELRRAGAPGAKPQLKIVK